MSGGLGKFREDIIALGAVTGEGKTCGAVAGELYRGCLLYTSSSRKMASDSRTASRRSRVMAPRQRTPRPGPGKGWR